MILKLGYKTMFISRINSFISFFTYLTSFVLIKVYEVLISLNELQFVSNNGLTLQKNFLATVIT